MQRFNRMASETDITGKANGTITPTKKRSDRVSQFFPIFNFVHKLIFQSAFTAYTVGSETMCDVIITNEGSKATISN